MGKTPRPLTKCNVAARRNARNFNDYRAQLLPNSGLSRQPLSHQRHGRARGHDDREMEPSAAGVTEQKREFNQPAIQGGSLSAPMRSS